MLFCFISELSGRTFGGVGVRVCAVIRRFLKWSVCVAVLPYPPEDQLQLKDGNVPSSG